MIISKQHVTDWIFCPHLFGKNALSDKYQQSQLSEQYLKIKKHIMDIAIYELKNACKLSAAEYRTRYTNKYFTNKKQVINLDNISVRLNGIFESFVDKAFMGYNIPVDIAIPGTNILFRNIIDFGLIDSEGNLTFIEIDKIEDITLYKKMLRNWPHYFTTYSFLAKEFGKNVNVIILDPISYQKIDMTFIPDRFDEDIKLLTSTVLPLQNPSLVKNLFACSNCQFMGGC